tara:strand:+ start:714 stop:1088 length:375 start_codon:yes stop_codon:yes gene_type:complete
MDILKLNKKAWDEIGEKAAYPNIKNKKYLETFNLFCSKLPKNASVLDFGCGPGLPITKELIKRGFKVTAIDISDTMIKEAKKNVPEAKYIQLSMTGIDFFIHGSLSLELLITIFFKKLFIQPSG